MMLNIIIVSYLLVLYKIAIIEASSCSESYTTISYVKSCPKSEVEWTQRDGAFNCGRYKHKCQSFVYHCTLNEFANATLEVCAPDVSILGQRCMEYNIGGNIIQDAQGRNCKSCPFSYSSTTAYKYQECYAVVKRNTTSSEGQADECINTPWSIVSVVSLCLNGILVILIAVITIYMKRRLRLQSRRKTPLDNTNHEDVPLITLSAAKGTVKLEDSGKDKSNIKEERAESSSQKTEKDAKHEDYSLLYMRSTDKDSAKKPVESGNHFWVSSIDIGDKYCGMAYFNPKSEKIEAVGKVEKISVLLTKDGELKHFGKLAREMYILEDHSLKNCVLIDELKITEGTITVGKHKFKTIEIYQKLIVHLLGRIRGEIDKVKPSESKGKSELDIHYVFTVPVHWKENMKVFKDAILKAEIAPGETINKEKLHLKFRRVAISPFIHGVKAKMLCLNFNVDFLSFRQNTTYALLHVGSTYCNLLFLQVDDLRKPDTILSRPFREKWTLSPEENFLSIFEDIFTPTAVEQWKKNCHREYISLLYEFEKHKARMYENSIDDFSDNQQFEFELSTKLCDFSKKHFDASYEEIMEDAKKCKKMTLSIKEGKCTLSITWSKLRECYQEVIEKTKQVIHLIKKRFLVFL
ncbi:uncharacterized protein LOC134233134 [Saccostrea cucullata]|uniref:uncharacterized protein LOC134233134 n=1 Tax=Saccostrea cuccullata TaxID=36930 RepID=UPI002ED4F43E